MRSVIAALILGAVSLPGCATGRLDVLGSEPALSPDGLQEVKGVARGSLFKRPNYAFGSYPAFSLSPTIVSFKQGARVLEKAELAELAASLKTVARSTIAATGRREVVEEGPCVARVTLGLVDLELLTPEQLPAPRGSALRPVGAVTLILEIRDAHTLEPLLRYGRREALKSRSSDLNGDALIEVFERFAVRFQREFESIVSGLEQGEPAMACEERAATS